ncbi:hypothetical protein GCM10023223_51560 [Stackebrandtia albiflava]
MKPNGYACKNRVTWQNAECDKHEGKGLPRLPEGERGPVRIPGYSDKPPRRRTRTAPAGSSRKAATPRPPKIPSPRRSPEEEARARELKLAVDQVRRMQRRDLIPKVQRQAAFATTGESWIRVVHQPIPRCEGIAKTARSLLRGAEIVNTWLTRATGLTGVEREFVRQLVGSLPVPGTTDMVMAARALQVVGVMMCLGNGVRLRDCPTFVDIVRVDGRPLMKHLLTTAAQDWTTLATTPAA